MCVIRTESSIMATQSDRAKTELSPEQIRMYRQHFEVFDLNGDGVISARELKRVSKKLGYRLTDDQIMVSLQG